MLVLWKVQLFTFFSHIKNTSVRNVTEEKQGRFLLLPESQNFNTQNYSPTQVQPNIFRQKLYHTRTLCNSVFTTLKVDFEFRW